jgi:methylmalonyl-CoA mutase
MAGVAIDSIYDMRTLFDRHPARPDERVDDHERRGAAGAGALHRRRRGAGRAAGEARGTIQNDILKEFMVRNTYIYPPAPSMRIISDIFAYTSAHMPKFNSISISGYHMQEAGATPISNSPTRWPTASNMCAPASRPASTSTASRRGCRSSGHRHELLHGGRQAARRAAAVGEADEAVQPEGIQVAVAAHALPDLGLVADRAGRLQQRRAHHHRGDGGDAGPHQSLHTNALDEALALPTDFSARIARNTQLVPAAGERHHPHHRSLGRLVLCRAADPRSRRAGLGHIQEVEALGGMAKAIEAGVPKLRIEEAAARTQARIDSGKQAVIGVNKYRPTDEAPIDVLKVDNAAVRQCRSTSSAAARERDPKRSRRRSRR